MIAIIGGVYTNIRIKMAMPERDVERQRKQDEDALLAAGIDINNLGTGENEKDVKTENSEDAKFRAYYEQKLREQANENYWYEVGMNEADFGGYSVVSSGDDADIKVISSGCSYNVAKYLGGKSKASQGEKPAFISITGNDPLGLAALAELQAAGVDVRGMEAKAGTTPIGIEVRNAMNDLQFAREDRKLMREITAEFLDTKSEILDKADSIFVDGTLTSDSLNYIEEKYAGKAKIYFDPASIQGASEFTESNLKPECIMPGRMEAEAMSGMNILGMDQLMAAGEHFEEAGTSKTIITLKGGGLYYKDGSLSGLLKPKEQVDSVDTKGAGDVLSAELMFHLDAGIDLETAAKAAMDATAEFLKEREVEIR